jgi:hypothetical protein
MEGPPSVVIRKIGVGRLEADRDKGILSRKGEGRKREWYPGVAPPQKTGGKLVNKTQWRAAHA